LANTAVAIFKVNVLEALGSPHVDLAVGSDWKVKNVTGQTKEHGAIQQGMTM
jgi:hypothetical protein